MSSDKMECLRIANGNINQARKMIEWLNPKPKEPEGYIGRIMKEYGELSDRIQKLDTFLLSTGFRGLAEEEKVDLRKQYQVMNKYAGILMARIARANGG